MRTFLLVLLLILAPGVPAVGAGFDLYVGEAAVTDQSASERNRALPLALGHVLQKLSGLRGLDEYPLVAPALARAPAMVLSYHYRKATTLLPDGSEVEDLRLVARFAEPAVDEMLRDTGLPLWRPQRKPVVAWLIVDDGVSRRIMPVEFDYTRKAMEDVADWRGLPISWPAPDADGLYAVDEQILWGGYSEDLAVSGDEGVLIAAARREGLAWNVRVNLGYQDQHWSWRLDDIDLQAALIEGMHQVVDQVAAANTILASDLGSWQQDMTVAGLRGAADYRRCLNYLQNLGVVDRISVVAAGPGSVRFRLSLSALPRYLEESIEAEGVLERLEGEENYRLVADAPDDS